VLSGPEVRSAVVIERQRLWIRRDSINSLLRTHREYECKPQRAAGCFLPLHAGCCAGDRSQATNL